MSGLKMSSSKWPRLLGASALMLALAAILALQAISSVISKSSPELATTLFAANGLAEERLAFQKFAAAVSDPTQTQAAAISAAPEALSAFRADALTPKALAILIMGETDGEKRRELLEVAARMNRREPALQSLVIQEAVAKNDYPRSIEALDQLLRVNPELTRDFFPILGEALTQSETIPVFANMLDSSSDWHQRFLDYAVGQTALLPNLAELRPQIEIEDEDFDRRLVLALARAGDLAGAQAALLAATGRNSTLASDGPLDWRSDYPPFDWIFVDETGLRTQLSVDGQELELYARPGKGGSMAARLLAAPSAPFSIRVQHRVAQREQARDVRIQLTCGGETTPFMDERFGDSPETFAVPSLKDGCDFLTLSLVGRAWSGRSPLNATVQSIEIVQ